MREEAFQAIYILSLRLSPRGRKTGVLLLPHLDICHHHHYICLVVIPVANFIDEIYSQDCVLSRQGCALGLLNIQQYYGLAPDQLAKGYVEDPATGQQFLASTRLTHLDALLVAQVATEQKYLDDAIAWLAAFPELSKRHSRALREHDRLLANPEHILKEAIHTFPRLMASSQLEEPQLAEMLETERGNCPLFSEQKCGGHFHDQFIFWPLVKQLCQGSTQLRPAEHDRATKCQLLDTLSNPYLRLGPFKLEHLNSEGNYVGQVHDMISDAEKNWMMEKAQSNLKATPYNVNNIQQESSNLRSSKVHYESERTLGLIRRISKRLELATGFKVFLEDRPYTAENYQVMNYGLGGKISLHSDGNEMAEDAKVGGGRLTTAMLYLTTVTAGGRTVFPRLGLSVEPKAGNLVFWHTR